MASSPKKDKTKRQRQVTKINSKLKKTTRTTTKSWGNGKMAVALEFKVYIDVCSLQKASFRLIGDLLRYDRISNMKPC